MLVEGESAHVQGQLPGMNEGNVPLSTGAGSAGKDSWDGTSNTAD